MSMTSAALLLLAGIAGYALLLFGLFRFQRRLLFLFRGRTMPVIDRRLLPTAEAGTIETSDGERLVVWTVEPRGNAPVLVYLPGALDNLSQARRQARFAALTEQGFGFLAIDYRGYGASTGTPSEQGFRRDARAAHAEGMRRFGRERLVLYGESMGTVLATFLAGKVPARALILEAPMLSMRAIVQRRLPFVPVRALLKDGLESDKRIEKVRLPLLVLHGERDGVVPFAQGRSLYERANPPKRFVAFAKGNHVNLPQHGSAPQVADFLDAIAAGTLPPEETRRLP